MDYVQVFYASEIGHTESEIIYEVVKYLCDVYGFKPYRQDEHGTCGLIDKQIFDNIDKSELFIAELSPDNRNVFIELGYARKKLGPEKIILFQKKEKVDLPFDIARQNTIPYEIEPHKFSESIKKIQGDLIRFFKEPEPRLFIKAEKESEVLFHFPKDTNISFSRGSKASMGGQSFNEEFGNIQIDHSNSVGNWDKHRSSEEDYETKNKSCSIMTFSSIIDETKKLLKNGDKLTLKIRAKMKGEGKGIFTFVGNGTSEKLNREVDGFFVAFTWKHSNDITSKDPKIYTIEDTISMKIYKEAKGESYDDDKQVYDISRNGLSLLLGTETINCAIEIYEIQLVRIRPESVLGTKA